MSKTATIKLTKNDNIYFDTNFVSNGYFMARASAYQWTFPTEEMRAAFYAKKPFSYKNHSPLDDVAPDLQAIYNNTAKSADKYPITDTGLMFGDDAKLFCTNGGIIGIATRYWAFMEPHKHNAYFADNFLYIEDIGIIAPMRLGTDNEYLNMLIAAVAHTESTK